MEEIDRLRKDDRSWRVEIHWGKTSAMLWGLGVETRALPPICSRHESSKVGPFWPFYLLRWRKSWWIWAGPVHHLKSKCLNWFHTGEVWTWWLWRAYSGLWTFEKGCILKKARTAADWVCVNAMISECDVTSFDGDGLPCSKYDGDGLPCSKYDGYKYQYQYDDNRKN